MSAKHTLTATELLKQRRRDEIWQKYCGYLDLTLAEFMTIQKDLLREQLQLLSRCELGRKLLGETEPVSIEAFRQKVPLTTYHDYLPYLAEKQAAVLPEKPHVWARTSGRSGEYTAKWIPHSKRMFRRMGEGCVTALILSSCSARGEVLLEQDDYILLGVAPPPYILGFFTQALAEELDIQTMPPLASMAELPFAERTQLGFKQALTQGMDYFNGLASVLVKVGEDFEQGLSRRGDSPPTSLTPRIAYRMLKGILKAKLEGRGLLPRDLWDLKGIMTGGMDVDLYTDRIERYWGRRPFEIYGSTEGGVIAHQTWNYKAMTFPPDFNFLEFIPYAEHRKAKADPSYRPQTRLLDELQPGIYELVLTNFHGSPLVRYRIGDLIEIVALRDTELGIDLPQMRFYSRADDVIFLAGFAVLTERTIWRAIENSGLRYADWSARKEVGEGHPRLHLYLELESEEQQPAETVRALIHTQLQALDADYKNLQEILSIDPLRLTILRPGTFLNYMQDRQQAGADLAHLKPPHMQASDEVIERLLRVERG